MTAKLPPNLLALFAPRPPLRYLPPTTKAPEDVKPSHITGVAGYVEELKKYGEEVPYNATECWLQRKQRLKDEKKEALRKHLTEGYANYDPNSDPQARGDPFRTLFVARLSYDVTEQELEREFGRYGPIERIRIVTDTANPKSKKKHRGYAFIVYEREKDMKAAYKETDGIKIRDRRVLVDVERGRTVKGWKPRRFGGGLGGRGYTKAAPARPLGGMVPTGPGGFRGGFGRGGFRGGGFRGGPRGGFGGGMRDGPPPNAPSGPGAGRLGGGGFGGGYEDRRGGRFGRDAGITGSNTEPVRPRDPYARERERESHREKDRYGYRDGGRDYRDRDRRDRDRYGSRRDYDYGSSRKRYHDEDDYEDPRSKRRY